MSSSARRRIIGASIATTLLPLGLMVPPATAATTSTLADFEGSTDVPASFYAYSGAGATASTGVRTVQAGEPLAREGQTEPDNVLSVTADVPSGFAGFGENFTAAQDLSAFDGLQFWMFGTGSGTVFQSELLDGSRPGADSTTAERFDIEFTDSWTGWRLVQLPFAGYQAATDFQPNPDDGVLDTDALLGYIFPVVSGAGEWAFDDIGVFADAAVAPTVGFAAPTAGVTEGDPASLVVRLDVASDSPVTVGYATTDGTATAVEDYTAATGTLTFAPGQTEQAITVTTQEDDAVEGNETVTVRLADAAGATLGTAESVLTIRDDDVAPAQPVWDNVRIIESFSYAGGIPTGEDADGNAVGFETFTDPNASADISLAVPPSPVPGHGPGDQALRADLRAPSYAGFTSKLTDEALSGWIPQDWSAYDGISFWFLGQNTGSTLFVDILDNRNPGSTTDDAGRFSVTFADDSLGWRYVSLPFSTFARKDIGNGAPNDGLTLTQMHGWAVGAVSAPTLNTWYVDDVGLTVPETVVEEYDYATLPSSTDANGVGLGFQTFSGGGGSVTIGVTGDERAAGRPGAEAGNRALVTSLDVPAGYAGFAHAFSDGGTWVAQDWSGAQGLSFWFRGTGSGTPLFVDIIENRAPGSTVDDAERHSAAFTDDTAGWRLVELEWADFARKDIGNGAPADGLTLTEVHGYAIGTVSTDGPQELLVDRLALWGAAPQEVPLMVGFDRSIYQATEGTTATVVVTLNKPAEEPVTVDYAVATTGARTPTEDRLATVGQDFPLTEGTLTFAPGETSATIEVPLLDYDDKWEVDETIELVLSGATGGAQVNGFTRSASISVADNDVRDPLLVEDFESEPWLWTATDAELDAVRVLPGTEWAYPGQAWNEGVGRVAVTGAGARITRDFEQPLDWSQQEALSFWYRGTGSGEPVTVGLRDDAAPDPGPAGWTVVYRDDFDGAAGSAPDPEVWQNEIGGWGWGNSESQYYTPGTDNVATDGENLVITVRENEDPTLWCVPTGTACEYTSARISTEGKREFMYGRIEARIKVPSGEGLWPAFWTLGNDFHEVGWPQTGEIDIMEHVEGDNGAPEEAFGTVHGPGYAGGQSIGNRIRLDRPLSESFHTFTVEWQPELITWYLDGQQYHQVTPEDVPGEWVFDHPFFLLLNVAIGGNFGGTIDPDLVFPKSMLVDYVEVAQAPDTAERFSASFVDDTAGWRQVVLPFTDFDRDATQPVGAPDNGLTLSAVHGISLTMPADVTSGTVLLDAVRVGQLAETPDPGAGPGTGQPGTPVPPPAVNPVVGQPAPQKPGTVRQPTAKKSPVVRRGSLSSTGGDLQLAWIAAMVAAAGIGLVVIGRRREPGAG